MTSKNATISFDNQSTELPIYEPTLGKPVIDVRSLGSHGHFTFDPGYYATASCESKITFINGEKGMLLYRGYPIDQLAAHCDYMTVCYLLMHGELPNETEIKIFEEKIKSYQQPPKQLKKLFDGFSQDAHPMGILLGVVGGLSTYYYNEANYSQAADRETAAMRLIALLPVVTAMAYRHTTNQPFIEPDANLTYAQNFMHMLFGDEDKGHNPELAKAMDIIFTLHADHEQNASTSTVRMAGSTGTDPFAAIAAGISALWGAAHGGANEACLTMLHEIGDINKIPAYIEKSKDKKDPFRLMGFGHRVYKSYDPRAKVMQKTCHDVLNIVGAGDTPLFKLAMALEDLALKDSYFIEKKLYPNVDFYSGITQSALGIPPNLFTAIFALARTVGWVSHWLEMMGDPAHRLYRPRQLYTGPAARDLPSK